MRKREEFKKLTVKTIDDTIRRIVDGKPVYRTERYNRFVDEVVNAKFALVYHEGCAFKGPGVKCATKKEISVLLNFFNNVHLPCRWEPLDKGYVVFPL